MGEGERQGREGRRRERWKEVGGGRHGGKERGSEGGKGGWGGGGGMVAVSQLVTGEF